MNAKVILFSYLATLGAILGLVCLFSSQQSQGAESANTGHINEDTRICAFDSITSENVKVFNIYNTLINRLDDVGLEGLTQAEIMLGQFLDHSDGCGVVAQDYRVVLIHERGYYALLMFDEGYGFVPLKYITWKLSFVADEVL